MSNVLFIGLLILLSIVILGLFLFFIIYNSNKNNLKKEIDINALEFDNYTSDVVSDELKKQLITLKRNEQPIQAIKKLREETNFNLIEAKKYIDNLD